MRRFVTKFGPGEDPLYYEDIDSKERITLSEVRNLESCVVVDESIKFYLKFGKTHREDGAAIIVYCYDSDKHEIRDVEYHLDGRPYSKDEWFKLISKENKMKYFFNLDDIER